MADCDGQMCLLCRKGRLCFAAQAVLYPGCIKDIYECPRCEGIYYWPIPSDQEIGQCYPHAYFRDFFREYWKQYYKGRVLGESLKIWKTRGRFLDVGCALGTLLAGIRDHSQWEVAGLELSPHACDMGQKLNSIEIQQGNLSKVSWPGGHFDYIHINNVLEHEANPLAALEAVSRLLSPGGRLQLTVPNGPVDFAPNRALYKAWGRAVHTQHGGHLFFFSRKTLLILLRRFGFEPLAFENFHFKLGFKARGLWPGSYKYFKHAPNPEIQKPKAQLPIAEYKKLIPPQPNWAWHQLLRTWRRLWRWPYARWGYDYEILAEKK